MAYPRPQTILRYPKRHSSLLILIFVLFYIDPANLTPRNKAGGDSDKHICEVCQRNVADTPYYCSIKPELPQCYHPPCPKTCEHLNHPENDITDLPPAPAGRPPPPRPVGLPQMILKMIPPLPFVSPILNTILGGGKGRVFGGRAISNEADGPEEFHPYDEETCALKSPYLRRIRAGSKYIEYRPPNHAYEIKDVKENAKKYGLVLGEFRNPYEWRSVEQSPILDIASHYENTAENPRIYYVFGIDEIEENSIQPGYFNSKFIYPTDQSQITYASLDPRVIGRRDEKCGVLTHVMGSDKKNYLTSRLWNCEKNLKEEKRAAYGLFMYPPGSVCHTKSQEECKALKDHEAGDDKAYNFVEIGQTLQRFIYFYSDQRTWSDAKAFCKAKGLHQLDLDRGDTLTVVEIVDRFLRSAGLSPITQFWTAGRYDYSSWLDNRFHWDNTRNYFWNYFKDKPPPFSFAWWDDQKMLSEVGKDLHRRPKISQPCVAMSLNPDTGGERPKLNFKVWYCDFPMYVLCAKFINETGPNDTPVPAPKTGKKRVPAPESCEKPPNVKPKPPPPPPPTEPMSTTLSPDEVIDPFDENTCTSKSHTFKRLFPTSKYVDYHPSSTAFSAEQIKEQCKLFGLVPGEIRTSEDWQSIKSSGITNAAREDSSSTDYFYVIGMDDSKEASKVRYNDDDSELTFSMFNPEGNTLIEDRCGTLDAVQAPDKSWGLMMEFVNCNEGLGTTEKVAFGLCMFPRSWKCYKESKEEISAANDKEKLTTMMDLGVTPTRSIFHYPIQRNWADALKVCEAAGLKLLDFDPKWNDTKQIIKIFADKMVKDGGMFQLTPLWTSGKLVGTYKEEKGTWETTKTDIVFKEGPDYKWLHLKDSKLSNIREGSSVGECAEVSFHLNKQIARFRPDYCDIPKYIFCYRRNKRRYNDPPPKNTLGITVVSQKIEIRIDLEK